MFWMWGDRSETTNTPPSSQSRTHFFRFPYGKSNDSLDAYVREEGLISFFWDVEAKDWEIKDESQLLDRIMTQVRLDDGGS